MRRKSPLTLALVVVLAACTHNAPSTGAGTPTAGPRQPSAAPAPSDPRQVAVVPSPHEPGWTTGEVTAERTPRVPPVPVLLGLRHAEHPEGGYDRVTFDFKPGELPGYTVKYVDEVRSDAAGQLMLVPGKEHLLLVIHPAQAHTGGGAATVTGTHLLSHPMVKSYAMAGDYEGSVSIALGLAAKSRFRTGVLPGRIYIDVAWK
jgi:hypothetical protein